MSIDTIIKGFADRLKSHPEFKATVKFDLGAEGVVHVDAMKRPAVITQGDGEAALTLTLSRALLEELMAGTKDPNVAYLTGKLKIRGPMGLAMKLNALIEG